MSAASVVERYLADAEAQAAATGRREYRVAAAKLAQLLSSLRRVAGRERLKKRRQRAQLSLSGVAT